MIRSKNYILAVALVVLPMLCSCRQELCYDHFPSLDVALSWEQVWERDYGMNHSGTWDGELHGFGYDALSPDLPEWVNLVKFKHDGSSEDNFLTIKGGHLSFSGDEDESFLLYNGDTEYIVLEDMASVASARATTATRSRSRSSLQYLQSLAPADTRTVNPPDLLYAAYVDELPNIGIHEKAVMPIRMQPLVYTYIIRFEFEYGLEHVALARGAIGGMAESVYLRNGVTSDETAILLYDCDMTDYGCVAYVKSFGVPSFPDEYYGKPASTRVAPPPPAVNLELRLTKGSYVDLNFDVSDQIANQPRGGVIRITGIRVEDTQNEPVAGGGFVTEVLGWGEEENIDLPL